MKGRVRSYLDLVRIPNVVTAVADSLAGFLYASGSLESGGSLDQWRTALLLGGASACLYAGGVGLNDVVDEHQDAIERPNRPLPAGRVSRTGAAVLCVVLLVLGAALAALAARRCGGVAVMLVGAIVIYNVVAKQTFAGPVVMGLCRMLNLQMGIVLAGSLWTPAMLAPAVLVWLYVASLTSFATSETATPARSHALFDLGGVTLAVLGLAGLPLLVPSAHWSHLFFAAMVMAVAVRIGLRIVKDPQPATVRGGVKALVLALVLVDACIAAVAVGWIGGLAIAALIIPAGLLSRFFRVA